MFLLARRVALAALCLVCAVAVVPADVRAQCAVTQSSPTFPNPTGSVFGSLAATWKQYFGVKVDANNGTLCNPTISGAINGGTFVNPSITGGSITGAAVSGGTISNLAAPLAGGSGGTGVNNGSNTITVGGNLVTNGAVTVAPLSTTNGLLYSPSAGNISPLATGNNGVLVTNGSGAPSISSTLPSGLTIPSPTISGTLTGPSGTWTSSGLSGLAGINNTPISGSTGAFTTLGATGVASITNSTASTSPTTGALVVTGGLGVSGAVNLGATPGISLTSFGPLALTVASNGANTILGLAYNNLAPSTNALPAGVTGYGVVASGATGNLAWGGYTLGQLDAMAGAAISLEATIRNNCGAPDTDIPPNQGVGTTTCAPGAINVTSGGLYNSVYGISISPEAGSTKEFLYDIYARADSYLTSAIFVDSNSSGSATGITVKYNGGNGNGLALNVVNAGSADSPTQSAVQVLDHSSNPVFYVRQTGDLTAKSLTGAKLYGGTAAGSTLSIASTSNGSPSGDYIAMLASTIYFQATASSPTFGTVSSAGINLTSGEVFSIGANNGVTKTCSALPTAMTITGGIITSITGGTCS